MTPQDPGPDLPTGFERSPEEVGVGCSSLRDKDISVRGPRACSLVRGLLEVHFGTETLFHLEAPVVGCLRSKNHIGGSTALPNR